MARTTACIDCGETFVVEKVKGRLPARCRTCFLKFAAARQRKWRAENIERSREIYAKANAKRLADPVHRREKRLAEMLRNYGLTPDAFAALITAQDRACAICGHAPPEQDDSKPLPKGMASTRLHVDHCHTTGRVRGLLCGNCNTMIGLAGENPIVLMAAVEYLQKG